MTGQRRRRGMQCIAAALCAVLVGGAATGEKAAPDCRLRMIATLDMQTLPDGRVTIPVKIEGHEHRLMVDTGGYINTVSLQLVAEEGYHPRQSGGFLRGMGTTFLNTYVTVKEFIIGHSRGEDFEFYVDDFGNLSQDGTLAPQILAAYDVDFDFGHGKFNLVSSDHCPGKVLYWTQSPAAAVPFEIQNRTHIRIPITIDGKEIMATVDTGAHTSFITMRAASKFLGLDEKDPALKSRGNVPVNGMNGQVRNYPFQTLGFGAVVVNHPNIQIVEDRVWNEDDLLLGIGILRQLHLYIAYKERKLYITPALAN
jgi:predicted aspartyl protease